MTFLQLIQPKVQNSTSTTRPRRPGMVSGSLLIQRSPATSGADVRQGERVRAHGQRFGGELRLLPVGSVSGHSGIAFTAEKVAPLIAELRSRADFVILDSSPLLTLADSFLLAQHSDNVLVVARQVQTKKEKAEAVRARLKVLGVKHVGVILTDSPSPESGGYHS